jgi:AraC-like DNA-binding protein
MDLLFEIDKTSDSILAFQTLPESFEFHKHTKAQLSFFEGGSAHLYTEAYTFFVPTNHFVWIPPGLSHKFVHLKKQKYWVWNLYIPVSPSQQSFYNETGIFVAHPLVIEVLKICSTREYHAAEYEFKLIQAMVGLLPQLTTDQLMLYLPNSEHHIMKVALSHILLNLGENLTLNETASRFNLGARTFSRLFEKEIGMTFFQYLKTARIMRATELIIEDKLNLTEIAFEVGYGSIAAFSNAFQSLMDKRPTDFKNKKHTVSP